MDDSGRNPWQWWQGGSAGSHLTDTGGNEEFLQSFTTPHYSVPNSDWQSPKGESWHELEQLSSWLHSDLEDHGRNAFSSGPFESIETAILSTNWEFDSQFREVDLNGNSHAESPEWWKNFLAEAGDGGVATAPGPEPLVMCSRATQGPSPKRNHTTSAKTAQNLKLHRRSRKKVDGVKNSKTGRRHRGPNWSLQENRSFLQHMEVEVQKRKPPWKAISHSLKEMNFDRESKACEDHWGVLLADLKKFGNHFGSDDILRDPHLWPRVGTMTEEQRSQNGLPRVFEEVWFEAVARIVEERSRNGRKHRESRRECFQGRIHVAEPSSSSSSRRHQSRVCAASATPSSEIFDNPVGDGGGISGLVELLGSNNRNATVDQIFEARRTRLEAQKTDLRKQEIELERDRMSVYQGQRNHGLTEKPRRRPPPAAHEWN